ncbi:MAG: DUF4213 domain-containing protein [Candidatus Marinimicrobia bacterium]|nr:DUF4213 domain-containing protein [Candidatus Neomarinimicrobiota bacterium]
MELLYKLIRDIPEIPVDEVIIGVHSTLVKSGERSGLASTIKYCGPHENVRHAGELETLGLKALAEYVLSDNLLEASVGMAAVNCFYSARVKNYRTLNAKDILLERGRNRNVGIIGHFPFLEEQKKYYRNCFIFEKQPREGDLWKRTYRNICRKRR